MLISIEKDQISVSPKNMEEVLDSSPMGSNSDSNDGLPQTCESPDSPNISTVFTDVNVVPEQEKQEVEQIISNLRGEISMLKLKQRSLIEKRREALNKILDIKGCIRAFCRVRPFLSSDRRRTYQTVSTKSEQIVVQSAGSRKEYGFDKVFSQGATQEAIFAEVEPIVKSALDGHNVCILSYGQTGTGKTYTMEGTNGQPGIVPRALEELFNEAYRDTSSSITFSMSMLEVYMGSLRDLLAPKPACRAYESAARCNLNIQTDPKGFVEVEGLTEVQIPNVSKAKWWYMKGRRVRSTSWTNVNEASSRSHCLMRITIIQHEDAKEARPRVSKLWMVDLGGSERVLKTGASGQTLDEGRAINLSLSALGDVIAALRRKRSHVPYRNSKLTQILKDSLGNGSKVLMLLHVSPSVEDVNETIVSLNFAKRARAVECHRELQEDQKMQKEKVIKRLEEDMREAEEECQKVRNNLKKVELLLQESIKASKDSYQTAKDEKISLPSQKEDTSEIDGTPCTPAKENKLKTLHSLPRFMTSTTASRQRQSAAERQIGSIARGTRSITRSSINNPGSLSSSHCDARFKAILKTSSKKMNCRESNIVPTGSPRCNGSNTKSASSPRKKIMTSSDPNLRVMLSRHRRRMSNLI